MARNQENMENVITKTCAEIAKSSRFVKDRQPLNFISKFTTLTKSLKSNFLSSSLRKRMGCDK